MAISSLPTAAASSPSSPLAPTEPLPGAPFGNPTSPRDEAAAQAADLIDAVSLGIPPGLWLVITDPHGQPVVQGVPLTDGPDSVFDREILADPQAPQRPLVRRSCWKRQTPQCRRRIRLCVCLTVACGIVAGIYMLIVSVTQHNR